MPESTLIRRCLGHDVHVERLNGRPLRGRLVNATRRSLWLVEGDEDVIVPLALVAGLRRAG